MTSDKVVKVLLALFIILASVSQGFAQGQSAAYANKKISELRCRDLLHKTGRISDDQIIIPFYWLYGLYSGKTDDVFSIVNREINPKLIGPACLKEPEQLLLTVMEEIRKKSKTLTRDLIESSPHVQKKRSQKPITEMTCRDIGWTKESSKERFFIYEAGAYPQVWLDGYLAGKQNFERTMGELMDLVNSVRPLRNACREDDEQKLLDIRQKSLK